MAGIKNMEGLTDNDVNYELANGGKFVIFEYCISILVMTFKRSSDIYFIKSGESTTKYSIGYTLLSAILGWWGIPWGPIYTIGSLYTNLSGGKDVTADILQQVGTHPTTQPVHEV
jgi:hypothetical protein